MDAVPFLSDIGRQLKAIHLEAVLIGNAAAALHGAPVRTVDFDFLFRKTPANPYYPVPDLYRVVRDDETIVSARCST